LKSVDYGNADYGASEAMTISMAITFDNANQIVGGGVGSAGTLVGRAGDVATGVTTGL
jgi:hypothetical protein